MPEYSIDLSNKECPNGHSGHLQIIGMNRELIEIECTECGWRGYDTSLRTIPKKPKETNNELK